MYRHLSVYFYRSYFVRELVFVLKGCVSILDIPYFPFESPRVGVWWPKAAGGPEAGR